MLPFDGALRAMPKETGLSAVGPLDQPLEDICQILENDSEQSRRLRQNSPFPGVLPASEIWSIKAAIRERYAKSAA